MIITSDDTKYIAFVKAHLHEHFLMSYHGSLFYFLGMEIFSTSLMASLYPEKIISRICLLVLLLVMTALLRLL
jgi:hypothetical protein